MSTRVSAVAAALLFPTAAFFSWGFYLFVPVTPAVDALPGHLPMSGVLPLWVMLQSIVGLLFILDLLLGRRPRVPFDLVWPVAVLFALSLIDWLPGLGSISSTMSLVPAMLLTVLVQAFTFWGIIHFARSRESVRHWLEAAVWGGGAACALSMAASATPLIIPTAPGASWLLLASFARYGSALSVIAVLVPPAILFAVSPSIPPARRWMARGALVLMVAVLVGAVRPGSLDVWAMGSLQRGSMLAQGGAMMVGAWLLARIAAKLVVSGRETRDPFHWALLGTVLLGAVFGVLQARLGALAFLPALAAAYAHPGSVEAPLLTRRTKFAVAAPFALLAAFNLGYVNPGNPMDTRNYAWNAPGIVESASAEAAEHLEFWEGRYPNEVQTHYRLAHVELAWKNPCRAAYEFAQSLGAPAGRTILPSPTEDQKRVFMDLLRDFCSALPDPEGTVAYEQALIATGRLDEARGLLQARVSDAAGSIESPLLKRAACALLGIPENCPLFDRWTDAQFLELLRKTGAIIEPAPEGLAEECLPVVCIARFAPHSVSIFATARDHHSMSDIEIRERTVALQDGEPSAAWRVLEQADSAFRVCLMLSGVEGPLAKVSIGAETCSVGIESEAGGVLHRLSPVPDAPVIRVWLSSGGKASM